MATYLILNTVMIVVVVVVLRHYLVRPTKAWLVTLGALLLLTLVFDNLLIALGMFGYAPDKILGLYLWQAPIEDFMYPLLAVILVPAVWQKVGNNRAS